MFLITASLLNSWRYYLDTHDEDMYENETGSREEKARLDFINTLSRIRTEPNEAMKAGIDFENAVTRCIRGDPENSYLDPRWSERCVEEIARRLDGAILQCKLKDKVEVDGDEYLLYGVLDALKADTVSDIKFTGKYETGKFLYSYQHHMYFAIAPGTERFRYLVCDGNNVYTEEYWREYALDMKSVIRDFRRWLSMYQDMETLFLDNWIAKEY